MKIKSRLLRVVLGASVGSVIWAGCATQPQFNHQQGAFAGPVDLLKTRPDTHPERRTGLYDFEFGYPMTESGEGLPQPVVVYRNR